MRHRFFLVPVLSAVIGAPVSGAELYGKPLRGLSPVPIEELARDAGRYRAKPVRVVGVASAGDTEKVTLSEGKASLLVRTDGSFTLPANLAGVRVTAEGKLKGSELVATGVEVDR
jgi:hypothetical protein